MAIRVSNANYFNIFRQTTINGCYLLFKLELKIEQQNTVEKRKDKFKEEKKG